MKRTLSFLTLALLLSGLSACSSENTPAAPVDAGDAATTDSAPTDTGAKPDTGTDTGVASGCATDLPSGYACPAFPVPAGGTACTEAMLQEYATKCVKADLSAPGTDCAAWKAANADCKTCVEAWSWDEAKVYPDDYKCYEKLVPGCGKSINCTFACADTVCGDCEDQASYDDCADDANKSGGRCFDLATSNANTCVMDAKGAPCSVTQYYTSSPDLTTLQGEIVRVLRGACRDNANWDNAGSGGDAGPGDTGTDAGPSDTGTDAGPSDTGTDADAPSGD